MPVIIKDQWVKKLQGVSLSDIKISLYQSGSKQLTKKGNILFTHFGISGPTVLNISKDIGELLKYGEVDILIDIFPTDDNKNLDIKLQELFKKESNKKIKNSLNHLISGALVPIILEISGINPDTFCHSITRNERINLIKALKGMKMQPQSLMGLEKAIISSGGVSLEEVDFKTMQSKIYPNLYLIGDILNIDRPSGGYSLQLCWTTGYVAGSHVNDK